MERLTQPRPRMAITRDMTEVFHWLHHNVDLETCVAVMKSTLAYGFDGEILDHGEYVEYVMQPIREQIDARNRRYDAAVANGKNNGHFGKLGGRPKKNPSNPPENPSNIRKNPSKFLKKLQKPQSTYFP